MSFRGRGGGRGSGRGRGGGGGRGRGGGGFGRGGGGRNFDTGPPDHVIELGFFTHPCEDQLVCKCTTEKVPYFNAPVYLESKSQIGKIDEIFGTLRDHSFSVKLSDDVKSSSFKENTKVFIDPMKLLPLDRFLPKPPGQKTPGRGRGGARGGRGGRGGDRGGGRGRGGFDRGRGGGGRGGGQGTPGACFKCGESGHMSRECPSGGNNGPSKCYNCGESGHMSRECPKGGGGPAKCFGCGETGHMSRDCPKGGGGGQRGCFNCGETGHMSRECTKPASRGRGGFRGGGDRGRGRGGDRGAFNKRPFDGAGEQQNKRKKFADDD